MGGPARANPWRAEYNGCWAGVKAFFWYVTSGWQRTKQKKATEALHIPIRAAVNLGEPGMLHRGTWPMVR